MERNCIKVAQKFEFFLTFPFNLGFSLNNLPSIEYLNSLNSIANSLNISYSEYHWHVVELKNKNLPLLLKHKCGIIIGERNPSLELFEILKFIFQKYNGKIKFNDCIKEEIVYYSYGCGSVNYTISASLNNLASLKILQELAMSIIKSLRANNDNNIYIFNDWERFREVVKNSFRENDVLYDMWGILKVGGAGRYPTRYVGENVILTTSEDPSLKGIRVAIEDLPNIFSSFVGMRPQDVKNLATNTPGVEFLAEGWDGQIAIISDELRRVWLKDLWQFATDYGAILRDLDIYLFKWMTSLSSEEKSHDLKSVNNELEAIERIQVSIELLSHETIPHNFGNITEQIDLYRGIYKSWELEKLVDSLKNKFSILNVLSRNYSTKTNNIMQKRINNILLLFTVLTFSSVISGHISVTDFSNKFLNIELRVIIIVTGTLLMGALTIIWFSNLKDLIHNIFSKRKCHRSHIDEDPSITYK